MINLNLLPPTQKEKTKKMAIYSTCENFIASIFITSIIIAIIFLISENILENSFTNFIIENVNTPKEIKELNIKIKKINSEVKTAANIQNGFKKWSSFLLEFNQLIPRNVQITNIEINIPNALLKEEEKINTLKISGLAKKRDNLIILEKNLENYPPFIKIDSPLSNILQQKNIQFTFNIELNDL